METYEEWCAKNTNIKKLVKNMKSSTPEQYLGFYLSKIFQDIEYQKEFDELHKKTFDIYIETLKLVIEYDGRHKRSEQNNDTDKTDFCVNNGKKIARIREKCCSDLPDKNGQKVIKYSNKNYSYLDIGDPIQELIRWINEEYKLSLFIDNVDIEKDADEILRYVQEKYHKRSIAYVFPESLEYWDTSKNEKSPFEISQAFDRNLNFVCPHCGEEFCGYINKSKIKTKYQHQAIKRYSSPIICNCEFTERKKSLDYAIKNYIEKGEIPKFDKSLYSRRLFDEIVIRVEHFSLNISEAEKEMYKKLGFQSPHIK